MQKVDDWKVYNLSLQEGQVHMTKDMQDLINELLLFPREKT